ncbi:MAG: hypothetical protein U5P41_02130 [Gammaproteobacteria bacterium]|nr:hypothetical protein [Gammaproteobacteria bacterium]
MTTRHSLSAITNPLNEEQRYVLYNDEIHLIDGRLYQRLDAPLTYYINPALTPPDSQLTRIRLPHGVISKRDDGWRMIPERLSDSPDEIAGEWQSARATYLKSHDPAESEFKPEVTLEFADHDDVTYRIVDTSSAIILARPDHRHAVSPAQRHGRETAADQTAARSAAIMPSPGEVAFPLRDKLLLKQPAGRHFVTTLHAKRYHMICVHSRSFADIL